MTQQPVTRDRTLARSPDLYISLGSVAVGVLVLIYSLSLPTLEDNRPGPGLFPGIVAGGFVVFGLILAAQASVRWLRRGQTATSGEAPAAGEGEAAPSTPVLEFEQETISSRRAWINGAAVVVGVFLYILLADTLGFIITMFLLTGLIMVILKARVVTALVTAVVLSLGLWAIFEKGLLVQLPNGLLW